MPCTAPSSKGAVYVDSGEIQHDRKKTCEPADRSADIHLAEDLFSPMTFQVEFDFRILNVKCLTSPMGNCYGKSGAENIVDISPESGRDACEQGFGDIGR